MRFDLPESVFRYCTDGRVASAVELLLSGRSPKIPDGLRWDELEGFYKACLAAQQTRVEWAIALTRLWDAVFLDHVEGWRASTISQQAKEDDIDLGIDSLWKNGEFTRDLTRDDHYLELQVEFVSTEGVRSNVGLWKDGLARHVELVAGSVREGDWVCSPWLLVGDTPELDLSPVREHARTAIAAANRLVGAHVA